MHRCYVYAVEWLNPKPVTERMPLCSLDKITCCQMFHKRPNVNVVCKCISTHWASVHLSIGPPLQEPTPCPISDLWANENVSSVLWNQWVSADAGHRGEKWRVSPILITSSGGFQQIFKFCFLVFSVIKLSWGLFTVNQAQSYSWHSSDGQRKSTSQLVRLCVPIGSLAL